MAAGALTALLAALLSACFGATGSPTPSPTATRPASQAASVQPSPSASVAASTAPMAPGTYARVSVDGLRIRVSPKASATAVGALFFSDVVRIRADAGEAGGFHWFEIETVQTANDEQLTGFIAGAKGDESYLEPMSGPPSPTPPRSPSASPHSGASESPVP
jgi:hypothetical protein